MGFREGAYAKVWEIEDKGNYHVARISISKKNKQTDEYETDFSNNFVRFIGTAHTDAKSISKGDRIKLGSCDVTNKYDKEKAKEYVNYLVFSFDKEDGNGKDNGKPIEKTSAKPKEKPKTIKKPVEDDDKLPFDED